MNATAILFAAVLAAGASKPTPLDSALASSLNDPSSVLQYRASESTSCEGLFGFPTNPAYFPACFCYAINAKNAVGGYTGLQVGVATLVDGKVTVRPKGDLAYNVDDVCEKRGMQKRDPKAISGAM